MFKKLANSRFWQLIKINLLPWLISRRTLLLFAAMLLYLFLLSNEQLQGFRRNLNMALGQTELFFIVMTDNRTPVLLSMFYFIMIAEIPKRINFQYQTLIRTKRLQWLGAQVLYCILLAFVVLLAITVFLYATSGLLTPWNFGWNNSVREAEGLYSIMPEELVDVFTPWQTIAMTLLPLFLFWSVLGLLILFFSLLNIEGIAFGIIGFVLCAPSIAFYGETTPIDFANFYTILGRGIKGYWPAMGGWLVCILVLVLGMFLYIKAIDLRFDSQNRL